MLCRLLKLYRTHSTRTPLEDFVTEGLTSILASNQELLDSFVNNVLHIDGSGFCVGSQKWYTLENDTDCCIDMVFENNEQLIFLENKVHSGEGPNQLERYKKVLLTQREKKGYLRYCTKYVDPKEIREINFEQLRWNNIHDFLQNNHDSDLTTSFTRLLEEEKIVTTTKFNATDLIVMNSVRDTLEKMNDVLEEVEQQLITFSSGRNPVKKSLNQIRTDNRYVGLIETVIGKEYSQLSVGFKFANEANESGPIIFIQLSLCKNHSNSKTLKEYNDKLNYFEYLQENDKGLYMWNEKPLINFLEEDNQKEELIKWFEEGVTTVNKFKSATPELEWEI